MLTTREMMDIALEMAGMEHETEDSGILFEGENIRKVLCGIDMDTPELLVARQMGYDCVVSHHPKVNKPNPQNLIERDQIKLMARFGVPLNVAQKAISKMTNTVKSVMHSANNERASSAAKVMEMPFMNIHTPADLVVESDLQKMFDERFGDRPETRLQEIIDALMEIREFREAVQQPMIRVGTPDSYAGRIAVVMSGGADGGFEVYKALFDAGVGTLVMMHSGEEDVKKTMEDNRGNIIIAGHMASDSYGMNRILEAWEAHGVEVTRMCGLI